MLLQLLVVVLLHLHVLLVVALLPLLHIHRRADQLTVVLVDNLNLLWTDILEGHDGRTDDEGGAVPQHDLLQVDHDGEEWQRAPETVRPANCSCFSSLGGRPARRVLEDDHQNNEGTEDDDDD